MKRFKPYLRAIGLAALVAFPVFAPALLGYRLISGSVTFGHVYFFAVEREFLLALGHVPGWLPQFYSGYPITLTLDGFLNPFFVLALKYLPALTAYHWLTYLFFVANILSAYAFARYLSLSKTASILAALTYAFSGIMVRWTEVIVFTALYPILPLSFLACLRIKQGSKAWWWALVAMLAYGWIGGFAELIVYDLVALGPFCLFLMLTADARFAIDAWRSAPWRTTFAFLKEGAAKYFAPVALSTLIAAPWLASVLVHISTSNRAHGMPLVKDALPLTPSYAIHMLLPRLLIPYGGNIPFLKLADDVDLYIGTMTFLILLTLPFVWTSARNATRTFFLGLLAFGLIMASNTPLYDFFHAFPVLNWFRWHFKWTFLTAFAAGMLVGYTADLLPTFRDHRYARAFVKSLWACFGLGGLGALAFTIFGDRIARLIATYGTAHYQSVAASSNLAAQRSPDYYAWIMDMMSRGFVNGFSFRDPWTTGMFVLWGAAMIVFTAYVFRWRMSEQTMRRLLIGTAALGCVVVWVDYFAARPTDYLLKKPATVEYLHGANAYRGVPVTARTAATDVPYRVFAYIPDQIYAELQDRYRVSLTGTEAARQLNHDLLEDNINMWFDVDGAFNHEPIASQRIVTMHNAMNGRTATGTPALADQIAQFSTDERARLLGAMNVKYVLTMTELGTPWALVNTSKTNDGGIPEYIYENPYVQPRWRFADRVAFVDAGAGHASPESVLALTVSTPATVAIERRDPGDGLTPTSASPTDRLDLVEYNAGRLSLTSHTANARWIVFSETSSPFWRATIDGIETPIRFADLAYQAVLVPPGAHNIEFTHAGFFDQMRMSLSRLVGLGRD